MLFFILFFSSIIENISESISNGSEIKRLILCYNSWQEMYGTWSKYFKTVVFHEGLPSYSDLKKWTSIPEADTSKSLIVLDDLGKKIFQFVNDHGEMSLSFLFIDHLGSEKEQAVIHQLFTVLRW